MLDHHFVGHGYVDVVCAVASVQDHYKAVAVEATRKLLTARADKEALSKEVAALKDDYSRLQRQNEALVEQGQLQANDGEGDGESKAPTHNRRSKRLRSG